MYYMFKQAFSEKNLRKIFDTENRKGNNLEKRFFKDVAVISEQIKNENKKIRRLTKVSRVTPNLYDQKRMLVEKKEALLTKELEEISQRIIKQDYDFKLSIGKVKGKEVYKVDNEDPVIFFLLKQIQFNLKNVYQIKQANLNFIVPQVKSVLSNKFPKIVIKLDISSFYESIPHEKISQKIINDPNLSLQTRNIIKKIFADISNQFTNSKGLPRGIGLSAYLSEYYMRDFDEFFRCYADCSYYTRYVDDIFIIFNQVPNSKKIDYEKLVNDKLSELSLKINNSKKDVFNIDNSTNRNFDFLGYNFVIEGGMLKKIRLKKSRVDFYDEKISKCFLSYGRQYKRSPNKAFSLLKSRLKFLTSNIRLVHNKNNVLVGVYFTNKFISDLTQLHGLDLLLKRKISQSSIISSQGQQELSLFSFEKGFKDRVYSKFPKKMMKSIQKIWRYS